MDCRSRPIYLYSRLYIYRQHQRLPRPPKTHPGLHPGQHDSEYPTFNNIPEQTLTRAGTHSIDPRSSSAGPRRACTPRARKQRTCNIYDTWSGPALLCRPQRSRERWRTLRRDIRIIYRLHCRCEILIAQIWWHDIDDAPASDG